MDIANKSLRTAKLQKAVAEYRQAETALGRAERQLEGVEYETSLRRIKTAFRDKSCPTLTDKTATVAMEQIKDAARYRGLSVVDLTSAFLKVFQKEKNTPDSLNGLDAILEVLDARERRGSGYSDRYSLLAAITGEYLAGLNPARTSEGIKNFLDAERDY